MQANNLQCVFGDLDMPWKNDRTVPSNNKSKEIKL